MPRIKINDISLNYELDIRDLRPSDEAQSNNDKGPVVIFINGLTMDVSGWYLQVRAFSERYKVLRYDCWGQGESDKPDEEYSQEMHADDLKSLMDKLGIQKAHIIGLSNGGMIAQHFALRYPEKVGALVLVDTCSYIDTLLEMIIKVWIRAAEIGGSELRYDVSLPLLFAEDYMKKNLDNILALRELSVRKNPPKPIISLAKSCLKHNVNDRISEIKAPTLIIVGEEDILIPPKYSKIMREKIQGSQLVIMKKCGHVPPMEKPEEFNETVINFLKRYDGLLE